jgi:hypothetical protein
MNLGSGSSLGTSSRVRGDAKGRSGARVRDRASIAGRWRWLAPLFIVASIAFPGSSSADDVTVPIGLQADLLVKVAQYDKNFTARAGERAQVLLVVKPGNSNSAYVASQMEASLARIDEIAGLPHDEAVVAYPGAVELATLCRSRRAAIVFFGPGFANDVEAIRAALTDVDILSATAVVDYVPKGIVLGFDVVSGRPKILVSLTQARRQNVALRAEALKLMKVFE